MTQSTAETLRQILEANALEIHTALPGVVRSYNSADQTAEIRLGLLRVLPSTQEEDAEDETEELPILQSVPVAWPRGGGLFLHWPLEEGDSVLVCFCEVDTNAWRSSGGVADPGLPTRHGLSGAVAVPGLYPRSAVIESASGDYGRLGKDGGPYIEFHDAEIRVGGGRSLARQDRLAIHLQAIKASLDTIASAAGAANSYDYSALEAIESIATSITKGE